MESAARAQLTTPTPASGSDRPLILLPDTILASLLHKITARGPVAAHGPRASRTACYLMGIALTYIPLLVAALLSGAPILAQSKMIRLPFLHDLNIEFQFLVAFPMLLVFSAVDQELLLASLHRVQVEGVLVVSAEARESLSSKWTQWFRSVNIAAQIVGAVVGVLVSYLLYRAYRPEGVGFWIVTDGRLLPVGYVYLYCMFLFYALLSFYILRNIAIAAFFKDLVAHSEFHILPFHPDKSGGLRPVGQIGLRNQYLLSIFGINVLLFMLVADRQLIAPPLLHGLASAAAVAYWILGPLVFVAPLLPFRAGMLRTKAELMSEVAQRLRVELQRLRQELQCGQITQTDEQLIDRLRKLGTVIDELPVWPFDAGTLRKFVTAYVFPLASAAALAFVKPMLDSAVHYFRSGPAPH